MTTPTTPTVDASAEAIAEMHAEADEFLSRMPEGIEHVSTLMSAFMRTIPSGTPPQVQSLLRRTFLAGAASVMHQVRETTMLPALEEGDPTPMLDAFAALGIGCQVLLAEEDFRLKAGLVTAGAGEPRIVLASDNSHAMNYGKETLQ